MNLREKMLDMLDSTTVKEHFAMSGEFVFYAVSAERSTLATA